MTTDKSAHTPHPVPGIDSREVKRRTNVIAFFLGMAIIAASIAIGRKYAFFISFMAFAVIMTLAWRKAPLPWIFLVSISAATPIAVSREQFACNVVFALCLAVINTRCLSSLPRWTYVLAGLAVMGVLTGAINWMTENLTGGIMRQGAFACNFLLAPFILLPSIYGRMRESRDHGTNMKGLLFCLIVPSTLILISAKCLGKVANAWEASQHAEGISEGFVQYQLGQVLVNFLRTEVGFILAALICASTAIVVSKVQRPYRLVAGACLISNTFLLLVTGSFGSILASLCGLAAIFYVQGRKINVAKMFATVMAVCCILSLTYIFSPSSVKSNLEKHYQTRISEGAEQDRFTLWGRAVEQFFRHPEGVGWTLSVGDRVKSYMHNDYLTYAVSYGFLGGISYASLVIGLLISFIRRRRRVVDDPSALAVYLAGFGVVVAIGLNSMTDHMTENRWYFNVVWSLIWYSYFCSRARIVRSPAAIEAAGGHPRPPASRAT